MCCHKYLTSMIDWDEWLEAHQLLSSINTHQYDNIHSSLYEQVQSVFVVLPGTDGCATQQLFARVFGGQRIVPVLLQICPGNNGHQLVVIIYDGKLACLQRKRTWGY